MRDDLLRGVMSYINLLFKDNCFIVHICLLHQKQIKRSIMFQESCQKGLKRDQLQNYQLEKIFLARILNIILTSKPYCMKLVHVMYPHNKLHS